MRLQGAIKAFTETGARLRLPYFLSLLARASYKAGRLEAAHAAVTQAFDESRRNHERWWDADLHRLRGEVLAAQGAPAPEIEGAFRQALAIAQTQQARSLELRAATALARWWHAQARSAEAHELLAPVYGWFSQGFDTLDLQAAQTLISELQTAPISSKSHPK